MTDDGNWHAFFLIMKPFIPTHHISCCRVSSKSELVSFVQCWGYHLVSGGAGYSSLGRRPRALRAPARFLRPSTRWWRRRGFARAAWARFAHDVTLLGCTHEEQLLPRSAFPGCSCFFCACGVVLSVAHAPHFPQATRRARVGVLRQRPSREPVSGLDQRPVSAPKLNSTFCNRRTRNTRPPSCRFECVVLRASTQASAHHRWGPGDAPSCSSSQRPRRRGHSSRCSTSFAPWQPFKF